MVIRLKAWFNKFVLDSPGFKTFFAFVLPLLTGILAGTLVAEITKCSGIDWKLVMRAKSTYGLIILIVVIYFYNRAIYRREKEVERFLDDDFCTAYMRSQCLPELAEQCRRQIRNGEGGEFRQAMSELKKGLK